MFDFDKIDDFLVALGCGDIHTQTVVNRIVEYLRAQKGGAVESLPPPTVERRSSRVSSADEITIQGTGGMLTRLASCCNPVKGDSIIGYTTRGRGVTIHRQDCRTALDMRESERERLIQVNWGAAASTTYSVPVRIQAYDREGLLRDVSTIVADEKVNVTQVTVPTVEKNIANMLLMLRVTDLAQLTRVLNRIEQLPNVLDVRRWKPG